MNGFNPLRHDCESQGCFNVNRRPKIEIFAECFPGKIAMADVDGIVEINGRFLFLEWKTVGASLSTGGMITVRQLSKIPGSMVIVAWGDAKTMEVDDAHIWIAGKQYKPKETCIDCIKKWMLNWSQVSVQQEPLFSCDVIHGIRKFV